MKKITALSVLFIATLIIFSCSEERNLDDYSSSEYELIQTELTLPQTVNDYELNLGEHFLPPGKTFPKLNIVSLAETQANNNRATLGRVLFYDNTLSLDRNVSCGTCHDPSRAFSDEEQFSEGVGDEVTTRNSLALATTLSFKISYNPIDPSLSGSKFSWDDRASTLQQQVNNAFRSENEMNIDDEEIVKRIGEHPFYPVLFKKAFGNDIIDSERIAEAIASFVDAISSVHSRFDEGLEHASQFSAEQNFYNFTEAENKGKELYNSNCASCHTDKHNFTVKTTGNNGLEMDYADKGVGGRLNKEDLFGVFKIPFLRNIELTSPYMHDGRFVSLEEVVDHYSDGVVAHKNLSAELKDSNGTPKRLNLNQEDKDALVAYLKTLTDETIASDDRFSDPFRR